MKAKAEIASRFLKLQEKVMEPFADAYNDALGEIAEEKKEGGTPRSPFPSQPTLKRSPPRKACLRQESAPRPRAGRSLWAGGRGPEVRNGAFSGGKRFAAEVFQPKSSLFEPIELTDSRKNHFLIRKVQDLPRVPAFDEIQAEVTHAWKLAREPRPLARESRPGNWPRG